MQRKLAAILPVLYLFILASCSKSNDTVNNNPPDPSVPDSNYLSRIFLVEPNASGEDTTQLIQFYYDNQKRVTWVYDSTYTATGTRFFVSQHFEYQGNDTLPFRMTKLTDDAGFYFDTTITYYFFNSAGLRIKDSFLISSRTPPSPSTGFSTGIRTYEYVSGKIYSSEMGGAIADSSSVDANGNITSNITKLFSQRRVATYTYDNHPNPYKKLNIYKTREVNPTASAEEDFIQVPNNITQVNEVVTGPNSGTFNITVSINYNNRGYPVSMNIPSRSTAGDYLKYLLEYKAL